MIFKIAEYSICSSLSTTKKHSKSSVNQWFTEDFSFQGR